MTFNLEWALSSLSRLLSQEYGGVELYYWALCASVIVLVVVGRLLSRRQGAPPRLPTAAESDALASAEREKGNYGPDVLQVFRIPHETVKAESQRNATRAFWVMFIVPVALLWSVLYWWAIPSAFVLAYVLARGNAHEHYPWAVAVQLEAEWVLAAKHSALEFHRLGRKISEIKGSDITAIHVNQPAGKLMWFDVHYRDQVTRIEYYHRLAELLQYVLKMAGTSVQPEYVGK